MKIDLTCMQALYFRGLIDKRIDRLKRDYRHYQDRRKYVSEDTYYMRTSMIDYEMSRLDGIRDELTRIIAIMAVSEGLLLELGVDINSLPDIPVLEED